MIRSTLSFCALFGALILGSKLLQESSPPRTPPPKTLGNSASPVDLQLAAPEVRTDGPAATAERDDAIEPTEVSASSSDAIHFVSYEDVESDKPRDPDDNDAPPRPTRELEDLLKDEPALESPALEKPTQSEPDERRRRSPKPRKTPKLSPTSLPIQAGRAHRAVS